MLLLLTIILIIYRYIFKLKNEFKYILVTVKIFSYNINMEDNIVKANWYKETAIILNDEAVIHELDEKEV